MRKSNLFGRYVLASAAALMMFAWTTETRAWTETVLHSFAGGSDGNGPLGGVIVDKTGNTSFGNTTNAFTATDRYVRITVTGASAGWASFYECQVYGSTGSGGPPAPTGLTATAASTSQINLSWTASSGATSYNVKRAGVSGGPYTIIATGITGTAYSNTGLAAGTPYYYVVSAVNANGESANSTEATATTLSPPPVAPTGLSAVAQKSPGKIKLTWTQSSSPGITQNKVYRSTTGSAGPYSLRATLSATTTYRFRTGLWSHLLL